MTKQHKQIAVILATAMLQTMPPMIVIPRLLPGRTAWELLALILYQLLILPIVSRAYAYSGMPLRLRGVI